MTLAPDEDLMLQVRDGAGEMLGVLFDRYQTPLFNFYSKLTGDRTLSEDLVQEVFLHPQIPPELPPRDALPRLGLPDCAQRPHRPFSEVSARAGLRARNAPACSAHGFRRGTAGSRAVAARAPAVAGGKEGDPAPLPLPGTAVPRHCRPARLRGQHRKNSHPSRPAGS